MVAKVKQNETVVCKDGTTYTLRYDLTNAELLRKLTTEGLAKVLQAKSAYPCVFCDFTSKNGKKCAGGTCLEGHLAWLNRKPKKNEYVCLDLVEGYCSICIASDVWHIKDLK
jgi:hypothetical protein